MPTVQKIKTNKQIKQKKLFYSIFLHISIFGYCMSINISIYDLIYLFMLTGMFENAFIIYSDLSHFKMCIIACMTF